MEANEKEVADAPRLVIASGLLVSAAVRIALS